MESASVSEVGSDFAALERVVRSRRSVRAFEPDGVPDSVVRACLELALLAPNSQNLHPLQFYVVRGRSEHARMRAYCLDQPAAHSAPLFVVSVARPDFWRLGRRLNLEHYARRGGTEAELRKFRRTVPLIFEDGPWHVLAPLKTLATTIAGWVRPTWRGPFGRSAQRVWATKSAALACENLMLAFRAAGFDTCPMEGFDEPRVARLLGLPRAASVVMVLAVGRRAPGGVSERPRFDREHFVKMVGANGGGT